jgi:TonB family protein
MFSDEARQNKITGAVVVVMDVSDTGHVEDVWLGQPLGFGLDEEAFKAVRQYVFNPTKYKGRPVGTIIKVVVSFQAGVH